MQYFLSLIFLLNIPGSNKLPGVETDVFQTDLGDLSMHFIGHGTLMFELDGYVIHIDPVSREADYSNLPDADLILVTHHHGDHLDGSAIEQIMKENTRIIMTETCEKNLELHHGPGIKVMKNGDRMEVDRIQVEAIPAYNIVNKRNNGEPFHPEGIGNGYILSFGDFKVLVAGDTENIPEIKALKDIDVAFLPMNLPYTMSPEMVADAARAFKPAVLYPYHFGSTDTKRLIQLMKDVKEVEIRIRDF